MKVLKAFLKVLVLVILMPVLYVLVSLRLSVITVNNEDRTGVTQSIYLSTNGIHLDIVLPKNLLSEELIQDIRYEEDHRFFAFGWGDEDFYLNTPKWSDLKMSTAIKAMFFKSSTLMHVSKYNRRQSDWVVVNLNDKELECLNKFISESFQLDRSGRKIILENRGYTFRDDFYKARGSYSIFKTCNSWVNQAFKDSGLKACLWTPFDFTLIDKYD